MHILHQDSQGDVLQPWKVLHLCCSEAFLRFLALRLQPTGSGGTTYACQHHLNIRRTIPQIWRSLKARWSTDAPLIHFVLRSNTSSPGPARSSRAMQVSQYTIEGLSAL